MKHRVRPATSLVYKTGDVVSYKRNESSKWKGPGIVTGRDNHQVFVKHGGTYLRVNLCHLRPSTDTGLERSNEESQMINYKQQNNSDLITVNYESKDGQDDSDLSVNEHPLTFNNMRFPVMIMRFQKKIRVTGQLYYHQMIKHMSWKRKMLIQL